MLGHAALGSASIGSRVQHKLISIPTTVHTQCQVYDSSASFVIPISKVATQSTVYDGNLILVGSLATVTSVSKVYDISMFSIDIGTESLSAIAKVTDSDLIIPLAGAPPELVVSRSGTTATIDVDNMNSRQVQLYRADGYRKNFQKLVKISSVPYDDTGLTANINYKYKASFAVDANKNGTVYVAESRRSKTRYTKGT